MRLLAFLLIASGLYAQSSLRFDLLYNSSDTNGILTDFSQIISVGGTGAATVALSSGACLELAPYVGASTPASSVNVTAPADVSIHPKPTCGGSAGPGVGTANYTVNITGSETRSISVTVVISRTFAWPTMQGASKSADYSSVCNSASRGEFVRCPYTPTRPGSWSVPAVGSTWVDVDMGSTWKRLVTGDIFSYPNQMSVNVDETMVVGLLGIYRISDGGTDKSFDATEQTWNLRWVPEAGSNPRLFDNIDSATAVKIYTRSGSTLTLQTTINMGIGATNAWLNAASKDGLIVRSNAANTQACIIDVINGVLVFCSALSHPVGASRDNLYISKGIDRVTGKYYLWYGGDPGAVYSFTRSSTSFTTESLGVNKIFNDTGYFTTGSWGVTCTSAMASAGWCIGQDHVDTAEIDGEQVLVTQNGWKLYFNRLTSDQTGLRNALNGIQLYPFPLGHVGCALLRPFCAGYTQRSFSQFGASINNLVQNGADVDVTVNLDVSPVWANGQSIQFSGVTGAAGNINGNQTISSLGTTTFKVAGFTLGGTYSASSTDAVTRATWVDAETDRNRARVFKLGYSANNYNWGDHRSISFNGTSDNYFADQSWCFVTPKGKYVVCKSNLGTPYERNIIISELFGGQTAPPASDFLTYNSQVVPKPGSGTLAFGWNSAGLTSCVLVTSLTQDFASPQTPTVTNSGGRMTATATSLTTGTQYWWRVRCDNFYEAAGWAVPN